MIGSIKGRLFYIKNERFSKPQYWTYEAYLCYKRDRKCIGCYNHENLETECKMRRSVFYLLKQFGEPVYQDGHFLHDKRSENDT